MYARANKRNAEWPTHASIAPMLRDNAKILSRRTDPDICDRGADSTDGLGTCGAGTSRVVSIDAGGIGGAADRRTRKPRTGAGHGLCLTAGGVTTAGGATIVVSTAGGGARTVGAHAGDGQATAGSGARGQPGAVALTAGPAAGDWHTTADAAAGSGAGGWPGDVGSTAGSGAGGWPTTVDSVAGGGPRGRGGGVRLRLRGLGGVGVFGSVTTADPSSPVGVTAAGPNCHSEPGHLFLGLTAGSWPGAVGAAAGGGGVVVGTTGSVAGVSDDRT